MKRPAIYSRLLFAVCTLLFATTAYAQPLKPQNQQIVLEASSSNGGSVDRMTLRRLVAWKKGQLILGKNSACQISLQVKRVISGQLPDDYVNRPIGANNLTVFALNPLPSVMKPPLGSVSRDGPFVSRFVSRWTLQTLPNGSLLVVDYLDEWKAAVREAEEKAMSLQKELRSGEPQRQYQALRQLRDITAFTLVPDIISLVDSSHELTVRKGDHLPSRTTLGTEARTTLLDTTANLRDRQSPVYGSSSQVVG
jgi:hypothetical protein